CSAAVPAPPPDRHGVVHLAPPASGIREAPLRLCWSGASTICAPGGTRTPNLLIRSQMLYPLSYGRRCGPRTTVLLLEGVDQSMRPPAHRSEEHTSELQ